MDPKQEAYLRVQAYLEKHKQRFNVLPVDAVVSDVRTFGPDTSQLLDSELRATVAIWMSLNRAPYTLPVQPRITLPDSKVIDAVKKGVTTLIEGVDIKRGDGKININVTGLTAELTRGDARVATGVSWGGTLGVEAQKGEFHVTGELSSEHWQIRLSYPQDTSVPDLSKLGKVFGEGEKAMRGIVGATSGFRSLADVERVKKAIEPHMQGVTDAVDAVKGIAKAPAKGVSFGISIGSPPPMPGETGTPRGVQGTVNLTLWF
jgi:hypothetical protein